MIGKTVYVKFGKHHGKQGTIVRETTKKGELAFVLLIEGNHVIKKQKNVVFFGEVQKNDNNLSK
ncbi:hypothetical protein ACQKOK_28240 [Bacillus cereus]|uniref:hypothetical protein n=1 Tax=Bacillus cereus TaxID=1396 RepID=UPI000BFE838D|nr:hypothetical protein COC59_20260 [Bacillus cereus]